MKFFLIQILLVVSSITWAGDKDESNMPIGCIVSAAEEYDLPPRLLHSLYLVERGKRGYAVSNADGTMDHGPFSINTIWVKKLRPYGIDASLLSYDPLVNARVAAWRLKSEIVMARGDVWRGVGNYRSRTAKYHNEQVSRVASKYRGLENFNYNLYRGSC